MKNVCILLLVLLFIPATGCGPRYTEADQLNEAIMSYDAKSIHYMMDHGVDPNTVKDGYRDFPVNTAVTMFNVSNTPEKRKKAEEIVTLMIRHGADINKKDPYSGSTMLHYATNIETVRLLVESGADVNATDSKFGNTPLHTWILNFRSDSEMVRYILKHGADVNIKNTSGNTVIDYAKDKNLDVSKDSNANEIYRLLQQYR